MSPHDTTDDDTTDDEDDGTTNSEKEQAHQEEEEEQQGTNATNCFETQPSTSIFSKSTFDHTQQHDNDDDNPTTTLLLHSDSLVPSSSINTNIGSSLSFTSCYNNYKNNNNNNEVIYNLDDLSLISTQQQQQQQVYLSFTQIYLMGHFHEIKKRHEVVYKNRNILQQQQQLPTHLDGPLFPVYRHVLPIDLQVIDTSFRLTNKNTTTSSTTSTTTTTTTITNNNNYYNNNTQQFISNVISDAFQPSTKLPQEYPIRRIRFYFYDLYAYAVNQIVSFTTTTSTKRSKNRIGVGGEGGIQKDHIKIYMSFENIPFHCIFPLDPFHYDTLKKNKKKNTTRGRRENGREKSKKSSITTKTTCNTNNTMILRRRHDELLLAQDYGLQSNYCICIGNTSGILIPNMSTPATTNSSKEYISFDSKSLCIRLLIVYPSSTIIGLLETKEYFIQSMGIQRCIGYDNQRKIYYKRHVQQQDEEEEKEEEKSPFIEVTENTILLNLYQQYYDHTLQQTNKKQKRRMNQQQQEEKDEIEDDEEVEEVELIQQRNQITNKYNRFIHHTNQRTTNQSGESSSSHNILSNTKPRNHNNANNVGMLDKTTSSIHLKDMEGILIKHQGTKKMKEIPCLISATIYTIVLGFSSPTLTRSGSYSMNITLLDPSLPLLENSTTNTQQSSSLLEGTSVAAATEAGNNNNKKKNPMPISSALPSTLSNIDSLAGPTNTSSSSSSLINDNPIIPHIMLVMFATRPEHLPKLQRAGDVLGIQRFKVQKYKDEVQLLGQVLGKSNDCWYAVCRPQHNVLETLASHPTSVNLSIELSAWMIQTKDTSLLDMNQVVESWKWGYHRLRTNPTIKSTSKFHIGALEQLSVYSLDIDAVMTEFLPAPVTSNVNSPKGYLRLWDGTGISISSPLPVGVSRWGGDEEDPSSKVVTSIESIIQQLNYGKQENELLEPPKALCGSVINVAVWETIHWEMIQSLSNSFMNVGKFIRLRNVLLSPRGMVNSSSLNLCSKSWLTPLPDTIFEISDILHRHATRIQRKEPYNPTSGTLPYPLLPLALSHLLEILPVPSSLPITFEFVKNSIRPSVDPNIPGALKALIILDPKDGVHKFLFSIRILDKTACLHVLVNDSAAQRLFGLSAREYLESSPLFNLDICTKASKRLLDIWSGNANSNMYYKGIITSFMHEGNKHFCLKSIE